MLGLPVGMDVGVTEGLLEGWVEGRGVGDSDGVRDGICSAQGSDVCTEGDSGIIHPPLPITPRPSSIFPSRQHNVAKTKCKRSFMRK